MRVISFAVGHPVPAATASRAQSSLLIDEEGPKPADARRASRDMTTAARLLEGARTRGTKPHHQLSPPRRSNQGRPGPMHVGSSRFFVG